MPRDRDDYRSMSDASIVAFAREEGVDAEMAIALAEKLARHVSPYGPDHRGHFRFNHKETNNA